MNEEGRLRELLINSKFTTPENEHMEQAHFKYRELLMEIKRRIQIISIIEDEKRDLIYRLPTVEACYLQFRKILELIALSSIVGNEKLYSKTYNNFASHWNARLIFKDMERINKDFYPRAINQKPVSSDPQATEWEDLDEELILTKNDFLKLYKQCGSMLHASNPYGKQIDTVQLQKDIPIWKSKIINLLSAHTIILQGDESHIYLFQMNGDGYPSYTPFFRRRIEDLTKELDNEP